jgi:hypothetical protein
VRNQRGAGSGQRQLSVDREHAPRPINPTLLLHNCDETLQMMPQGAADTRCCLVVAGSTAHLGRVARPFAAAWGLLPPGACWWPTSATVRALPLLLLLAGSIVLYLALTLGARVTGTLRPSEHARSIDYDAPATPGWAAHSPWAEAPATRASRTTATTAFMMRGLRASTRHNALQGVGVAVSNLLARCPLAMSCPAPASVVRRHLAPSQDW